MDRDTVSAVTERPAVDYAHLPGEEHNPLMENTEHVQWTLMLLNAASHTLAGTGNLVTGNVPFSPDDGGPHTAPDIMVLPGMAGRHFGRYTPGVDGPMPTVAIEILSPSNTRADIQRRCARLLRLGIGEVYVLDPKRDTIVAVTADDGALTETSAVGRYSPGLQLSFTIVDHQLALCCPGGRIVRPGDDPFGWLLEEMNRADAESSRADAESSRADAESSRADAESSRADAESSRADSESSRADALARALAEERAEFDQQLAERARQLDELRAALSRSTGKPLGT